MYFLILLDSSGIWSDVVQNALPWFLLHEIRRTKELAQRRNHQLLTFRGKQTSRTLIHLTSVRFTTYTTFITFSQHIRSLIFSEDEVDLQKIICLHLLSVHRAETLTPPKKRARYICREHSPCERLIERSKKGFTNFERLSKLLPLYTIGKSYYHLLIKW